MILFETFRFDAEFGPDPDESGVRELTDAVGRIISHDWVEGIKGDSAGDFRGDPPGSGNGAQGDSRVHPISTNESAQDVDKSVNVSVRKYEPC